MAKSRGRKPTPVQAEEPTSTVAEPIACFLGDLSDDWIKAIADALPTGSDRIPLDSLTELAEVAPPRAPCLVVHRSHLSMNGEARLRAWRESGMVDRLILVAGPYARYAEIQRWATLADSILWEATASEVVANHVWKLVNVKPTSPTSTERPQVTVVSGLYELRSMLVEACRFLGYTADSVRDWSKLVSQPNQVVVCDAPWLEPGWANRLAEGLTRASRPSLVFLDFADRDLVRQAKQAGATACLDLPCDLEDLAFVLERLAATPSSPAKKTTKRRRSGPAFAG